MKIGVEKAKRQYFLTDEKYKRLFDYMKPRFTDDAGRLPPRNKGFEKLIDKRRLILKDFGSGLQMWSVQKHVQDDYDYDKVTPC